MSNTDKSKTLFSHTVTVRMHDTDLSGVIYFAKQFRFAHDTWEEFLASHDLSIQNIVKTKDFSFAVRHAEADYLAPLYAGDKLRVDLSIRERKQSSFITDYKIYKETTLVGTASIVFVCIDQETKLKRDISLDFLRL